MRTKTWSRGALICCSFLLIVCMSVGGTVALLIASDTSVTRLFAPSTVQCDIVENNGSYRVVNVGNTAAYIRVAAVPNWIKDGNVYGMCPIAANVDYRIDFDSVSWTWYNGYFYYNCPLAVGEVTMPLSVVQLSSPPEGCMFQVEVLAEGIQSEPVSAAFEAWGYLPSGN
jgi:hypothetical protein